MLTRAVVSVVWHEETVPRQWSEGLILRKVIGRIRVIVSLY